jgi:putative metallohydrolase (TIGR04338 family)
MAPLDEHPVRDGRRAAVYAAEDQVGRLLDGAADFPVVEVAGSSITLPVERHFADTASLQRYVDAVLALNWVRGRWPAGAGRAVTVRKRKGTGKAHYERESATIALPIQTAAGRWARRELVVLHEVAHHLGDAAEPAHGGAFVARLTELTAGVIGPEVALLFRVACADQGVTAGASP